jgi:hypothetical protein
MLDQKYGAIKAKIDKGHEKIKDFSWPFCI